MHAIGRPYGMILVTGPTGSGKTVSLYTCLNILNQPGVNISTAEDPREIQLPGVNQVNVNDKAGLTFAAALKAFLRQDPDIIMVGEIRDLETADIAIKAAQTGPPRAVDAAHQRRAHDAHAPAQHGRRAVQHRLVGDPHHRAAPRPPAVLAMQEARGHPARGAAARGLHAGRPGRLLDALRPGRLRPLQGHAATRAASASTRSCRSPTTCARSSCATATRSTSPQQAQKEGVRDLRQSGLLKVKSGRHVARGNRSDHQRVAT